MYSLYIYSLYIIWSSDRQKSYVGTASDLIYRLDQHNNGEVKSTKAWRPWILIHSERYHTLSEARKREWFLKCTPQGGKLKRKIITEFLRRRDGGH